MYCVFFITMRLHQGTIERATYKEGGGAYIDPDLPEILLVRAVARTLIGGGVIFIYAGSARLISFEIKLI